jgi:hypothetical protein
MAVSCGDGEILWESSSKISSVVKIVYPATGCTLMSDGFEL